MHSLATDEYLRWTATEYSELRNLTVTRLTLFNARRGGEPARMTLHEWSEAKADNWIGSKNRSDISESERQLFHQTKSSQSVRQRQ
jgi:hypothetical protein